MSSLVSVRLMPPEYDAYMIADADIEWSRPRKCPSSWVAIDCASTFVRPPEVPVPVMFQPKPTLLNWMFASRNEPPVVHTGVVTPMTEFGSPSSAGQLPESH